MTAALEAELESLDSSLIPSREPLRPAEAADRLSLHLGRIIRRALQDVPDASRVEAGIRFADLLIGAISDAIGSGDATDDARLHAPKAPGEILRAILAHRPDGTPESIPAPLIPLLDTTLLTNAPGEPRVGQQIATEIASADRIDVVMAFIRRSGIRPLMTALGKHVGAGRPLRVLTTTYTGSTEARALEQLNDLGADVRVSYDTTTTRLHAKAWLFHRDSGYSTAYIGSSNLTHSAQVTGLEWNVRASAARNPDVIDKVGAVFDSYWESPDFRPYDPTAFERATRGDDKLRTVLLSAVELRPEPFQERLLELIEVSRSRGHHRNLLVSATGTGKTVMAALDYVRLRDRLPRARLLFVAHRKEILEQTLHTFRYALRDQAFGELWVDGRRPTGFDFVFASIQSIAAAGLEHLAPAHFDVVIIDEFHHAAAKSYAGLLDHLKPVELLGLTATPERADGLPILHWFGDRIAAELRVWDAIDQHRLVPFLYFGIHDGLDLREVPWRRGRGYDVDGLTHVMTADESWARLVLKKLIDHVDDVDRIRCLGFCVSVDHARFMARVFTDCGVPATAVSGSTSADDRRQALDDLRAGRVKVLFSVDLFNEGVDLPTVDTLLLLRPTDSATLFLQQLGRGLRKSTGKTECTVLDFVGQHRREFRFDRRLRALLGGTRKDVRKAVESGFPFLPAGCHMEFDPVASEVVLRSLRESLPSTFKQRAAELAQVAATTDTGDVDLATFLDESGLELDDVYASNRCWSDLRQEAGLPTFEPGADERVLRRACGRLLHVDDDYRLDTYARVLASATPPDLSSLPRSDVRALRGLLGSLFTSVAKKSDDLQSGLTRLWSHPQVRAELRALVSALAPNVTHVHHRIASRPDLPLRIHARYTRQEILAAFDIGSGLKIMSWQTGVFWAKEQNADLFAFTLDKTSGSFSPTTRYSDYAIDRQLIHWESQSQTRADSPTGVRYQTHESLGSDVMLFARLRASDRAFWFLGPATYVSHRSECPMAIRWRLHCPLPGDLFASFAAAVA